MNDKESLDESERLRINFKLMNKISTLEKIKAELSKDNDPKEPIESQAYTDTSLMRIVVMLDQLISLTTKSPEGLDVLKRLTRANNLQLLIQISVSSSIRNQILV